MLQFYLAPLYNLLLTLIDSSANGSTELSKFRDNEENLRASLDQGLLSQAHCVISYMTVDAFLTRDMKKAARLSDTYREHFRKNDAPSPQYTEYYNYFYDGLISFFFARTTGEECWRKRGDEVYHQMENWSRHSVWNFENNLLLLKAERHNTLQEPNAAIEAYEASIESARKHRFIHEEAIACELAAYFCARCGNQKKARELFKQSYVAYMSWGAHGKATSILKFLDRDVGGSYS